MEKHLVVKYFDTYQEDEEKFNTKKEALEFINYQNDLLKNSPLTSWEYRGVTK